MLHPRRRNLQLKLALLVVLIAAGIWFGVGNQKNSEPAPSTAVAEVPDDSLAELGFETPTKATPAPKSGSESGATSAATPITSPHLLNSETKAVILDCAKGSEIFRTVSSGDYFDTLDEFLQQAIRQHDKPSIVLQYRNVHALDRNGEKIRLHVATASSEEASSQKSTPMEVQFFGVDQDDLPIPMDLPRDYQSLTWTQMIQKFLTETHGQTLDESQNSYRWSSGASAQITDRNGQIEELQIYLENQDFLGCGVREGGLMDCQCQLAR